jgi:hypothetical protein
MKRLLMYISASPVTIEAAASRTWVEAGPEVVINEALARQRTEGWNSVRPAISVTVR